MKSQTEEQATAPRRAGVHPAAVRGGPGPLGEFEQIRGAIGAIRRFLSSPGEPAELLTAIRGATGADEVFLVRIKGDEIALLAAPVSATTTGPPELVAELGKAGTLIDPAGARRLGGLLGARSAFLSAGVCSGDSGRIGIVCGWGDQPGLSPESMAILAETVGMAREVIARRERSVRERVQDLGTKWAYEIHDDLTQTVAATILELEGLRRRVEADPREALESLSVTKAEVRNALGRIRRVLFDLEEPGADPADVPLQTYIHEVVGSWTLTAKVRVEGDLGRTPREVQCVTHLVIREGVANVAKHSGAESAEVEVRVGTGEVLVRVEDCGRGFEPDTSARSNHFGLRMIRRRVEEAGGTLEVDSEPGSGSRIAAHIPIGGKR